MELWDIYDENRNITNRTHIRGQALADGDYHLVVHVWIVNSNGEILLSQRSLNKTHPNLWECSGGSVVAGENSLQGAFRETKEELGIELDASNGKLIKSTRRDIYKDFYDVWLFKQDIDIKDIVLQEEEVSDAKWVTPSELEHLFKSGELVPTLGYFKIIFEEDLIQ